MTMAAAQPPTHVSHHKAPHPGSAVPPASARRDAPVARVRGLSARLQAVGWLVVAAMLLAIAASAAAVLRRFGPQAPLAVALACEWVFGVWYYRRARELSRAPCASVPSNYDADRVVAAYLDQSLFFRFNERYATPWFMDTPLHLVARGNLADLLAYGFWYKTVDQMREDGQGDKLEAMIDRLEAICNIKLPPGKTPGLSFMAHLWHPLRHVWRPAAAYLFCEILALGNHLILRSWGFRRLVRNGSAYYVRGKFPRWHARGDHLGHAAADGDGFLEPVLFLHGVGAGSGPYLPFIAKIAEYSGRPMIVPIFKHVSMRVTYRMPTVEDMVDDIVEVMRWLAVAPSSPAQSSSSASAPPPSPAAAAACEPAAAEACAAADGPDPPAAAPRPADVLPPSPPPPPPAAAAAHVIAHSYGSLVASRLCQASQSSVASLMLVDPVCFAMYMPTLLRSFLYALPASGAPLMDFLMWVVARELHCVAAFCRGFFWSDYNLWPESIPDRALVALSGHDILTPNPEVRSWLEEETAARVVYHDGMRHAGFVLRPSYQDYLLQHWRAIVVGKHRPDVSEMLRREANGENHAGELYVRQIAYAGGAAARGALGHPGYVATDAWTARIASELEVKDGKARYYRKATAAAALGQAAFSLAMARRRNERAAAMAAAAAHEASSCGLAAPSLLQTTGQHPQPQPQHQHQHHHHAPSSLNMLLAGSGPSMPLDVAAATVAAAKANNGVHHRRRSARSFLASAAAGGQGLLRSLVASGSGALSLSHSHGAGRHGESARAAAAAAAAAAAPVPSQALPALPAPLRSHGSRSTGGGAAAAALAAAAAASFAAAAAPAASAAVTASPLPPRPLSASSGGALTGRSGGSSSGSGSKKGAALARPGLLLPSAAARSGAGGGAGSLVGGGPDLTDPRWASALAEVTKAAEARRMHCRQAPSASAAAGANGAGGVAGGAAAAAAAAADADEHERKHHERMTHVAVSALLPPGAAYILYRDPESEPLARAASVDTSLVARAAAKAQAQKARERKLAPPEAAAAAAAAGAAAQRLLQQQMSVGATSLLAPQMSIAEERSSDLAEDGSGDDAEAAARREEEALAVALEAAAASLRQQQRARRRAVAVRQARRAAVSASASRKASDGGVGASGGGCGAEERRTSSSGAAALAGSSPPQAVAAVSLPSA